MLNPAGVNGQSIQTVPAIVPNTTLCYMHNIMQPNFDGRSINDPNTPHYPITRVGINTIDNTAMMRPPMISLGDF